MERKKTTKDFIIKFKGLSTGIHEFSYSLNDVFFNELEEEELLGGDLKLRIVLNKEESMLTFDFFFDGSIVVMCDRCLENFSIPIKKEEKLYAKFSENSSTENESDEILYIKNEEYQINFFDYIRESILIALPIQKVHPVDVKGNSMCNSDMIARIETLSVNIENENNELDPRWAKLRDIKI